jgi:hypothetical protein
LQHLQLAAMVREAVHREQGTIHTGIPTVASEAPTENVPDTAARELDSAAAVELARQGRALIEQVQSTKRWSVADGRRFRKVVHRLPPQQKYALIDALIAALQSHAVVREEPGPPF